MLKKGANEVSLTSDELIDIMKKRDWSQLWFYKQSDGKLGTYTYIYVNEKADDVDFFIHTPDNLMDETIDRVIDALEHLDECMQRAYVWLSKQNLCDVMLTQPYYSPQELEQLFTLNVLNFNEAGGGDFVMTFLLTYTDPWWYYDIWFHYDDLQPYKSKNDLW